MSLQVSRSRPLVSAPGRGATAQVRLSGSHQECTRDTWVHGSHYAGELLAAAFRSFLHIPDCSDLVRVQGTGATTCRLMRSAPRILRRTGRLSTTASASSTLQRCGHCSAVKAHGAC